MVLLVGLIGTVLAGRPQLWRRHRPDVGGRLLRQVRGPGHRGVLWRLLVGTRGWKVGGRSIATLVAATVILGLLLLLFGGRCGLGVGSPGVDELFLGVDVFAAVGGDGQLHLDGAAARGGKLEGLVEGFADGADHHFLDVLE